jgi:hypothetical protein
MPPLHNFTAYPCHPIPLVAPQLPRRRGPQPLQGVPGARPRAHGLHALGGSRQLSAAGLARPQGEQLRGSCREAVGEAAGAAGGKLRRLACAGCGASRGRRQRPQGLRGAAATRPVWAPRAVTNPRIVTMIETETAGRDQGKAGLRPRGGGAGGHGSTGARNAAGGWELVGSWWLGGGGRGAALPHARGGGPEACWQRHGRRQSQRVCGRLAGGPCGQQKGRGVPRPCQLPRNPLITNRQLSYRPWRRTRCRMPWRRTTCT